MKNPFLITFITLILVFASFSVFISPGFWWTFVVIGPLFIIGLVDMIQTKHALRRNFPLVGHTRYIAEWMRPKVYQYFVEPDFDGRPFSRIFRSIVYQRAKKVMDTAPFGTQFNVYTDGYEWMNHSIAALDHHTLDADPRVIIGGPHCAQKYSASLFNISAMSFGSLSKNAILAMNGGAKIGGFAHNTGEGGISPYHLKPGGDLIYQIGTGYFGCRTQDGQFDPELFRQTSSHQEVKMIELKLSQGAKPGHGGILPAIKATPEIAKIRNIEPWKTVMSPPFHTAFQTPRELVQFIHRLRELSEGKPIGLKMCIGHRSEFLGICKAIVEEKTGPDYISIDGGEGGTGAAPLEFSNSVGMPYRDALAFAYNALVGFGIKNEIKLLAAGKIVTGYHVFRALALGADATYSARAMMMAVGCIQALECNKNTCPTGVATQKPKLVKGLVVSDKTIRIANYHEETINSFVELQAASGLKHHDQINRSHIYRRAGYQNSLRYDQLYPYLQEECLTDNKNIPMEYADAMRLADPDQFMPKQPLDRLHV